MHDESTKLDNAMLMDGLHQGDRRAFDCIFRRYYVDIVMFCARFLHRSEDCEDVAQAVFLRLWETRENLPRILSLKSYLLRSAQNACLNELHHRNIVQRYSSEYLTMLPDMFDDDASKPLLYSDLVRLIASAEATLQKNEFETWYMSRYKGMKYAEIAIALGISVRTVEDRIARAKLHFRKILNRYWAIVLILLLN